MPDEQQQPLPDDEKPRTGHPLTDMAKAAQSTQPKPTKQTVNLRFPETVTFPRLTYILIAINVMLRVLLEIAPDFATNIFAAGYLNVDAVLEQRQVYRLVTMMFLHVEWFHLLFNCLALYYIGQYVERFYGPKRFLLIYLLGGLGGSILSLYVNANSLGASGAIMAIWGAELVFWYQHRKLFGTVALQHLRWTGFVLLFNFVIGIAANAQGTANINNIAHLGGLIGGVVLAWFIAPRFVAMRVKDPKPGQSPVRVVQANPLQGRVREILFYSVGLAALLLLAIVIAT
jgi:rhomboid protease GluP